jgi:hypothetical protein
VYAMSLLTSLFGYHFMLDIVLLYLWHAFKGSRVRYGWRRYWQYRTLLILEDVDFCVKEPCFLFIDNITHCNEEWLKKLVRMSKILLALYTKT